MALSTLTSKGQLTVPKSIRDHLQIEMGDKVEFIIDEEGQVVITAKTLKLEDIVGMVKTKKTATIEEINKAIADGYCGDREQ